MRRRIAPALLCLLTPLLTPCAVPETSGLPAEEDLGTILGSQDQMEQLCGWMVSYLGGSGEQYECYVSYEFEEEFTVTTCFVEYPTFVECIEEVVPALVLNSEAFSPGEPLDTVNQFESFMQQYRRDPCLGIWEHVACELQDSGGLRDNQ